MEAGRVAVPGCHATGFAVLAAPLVQMGLVPADYPFSLTSLTGYSGGGKSMIADYEAQGRDKALDSPRSYGLTLHHKHLPEMQAVCGLTKPPVFVPVVADYYCGMQSLLPLHMELLKASAEEIARRWHATTQARARSPSILWARSPVSWPPIRWPAPTVWKSTAPPPPTAANCCWRQSLTIWARALPARRYSA